jgi:hypothetical protein
MKGIDVSKHIEVDCVGCIVDLDKSGSLETRFLGLCDGGDFTTDTATSLGLEDMLTLALGASLESALDCAFLALETVFISVLGAGLEDGKGVITPDTRSVLDPRLGFTVFD